MNKKQIQNIFKESDLWEQKLYDLSLRKDKGKKGKIRRKKKTKNKTKKQKIFRTYKEYIVSREWRKKREKILARANGICEDCKCSKATQIHHKTYKHLYNEKDHELIALCSVCHREKHGLLTEEKIEIESEVLFRNSQEKGGVYSRD